MYRLIATSLLLAGLPLGANAGQVVLDFEEATPGFYPSNYIHDGFRLSPNCHYDLLGPGGSLQGYAGSNWMGFDGSACSPGYSTINADYLRPGAPTGYGAGPEIWMDYSGRPFSLESIFLNSPAVTIHSSKGGVYRLPIDLIGPRVVSFSGGDWQGIQWILFEQWGADAGAPQGFDQIVLRVPAPGTAALLALGLITAFVARRRAPDHSTR